MEDWKMVLATSFLTFAYAAREYFNGRSRKEMRDLQEETSRLQKDNNRIQVESQAEIKRLQHELTTKVDGNTVVTATMAAAKGIVGADDICVEATAAKLSNGNKEAVTKYAKDAIGTAAATRAAEQLPPHNNETLMILVEAALKAQSDRFEAALLAQEQRMQAAILERDARIERHRVANVAHQAHLDEEVAKLQAKLDEEKRP